MKSYAEESNTGGTANPDQRITSTDALHASNQNSRNRLTIQISATSNKLLIASSVAHIRALHTDSKLCSEPDHIGTRLDGTAHHNSQNIYLTQLEVPDGLLTSGVNNTPLDDCWQLLP